MTSYILLSPIENTNTFGSIGIDVNSYGANIASVGNNSEIGLCIFLVSDPIPITPQPQEIYRPTMSISRKEDRLGDKFYYKDISISGKAHPLTGDLVRATDFAAVGQSMRNILMTNKKERFFGLIGLGAGLRRKMFDLMDVGLAANVKEDIIVAITTWEPRAIIKGVNVKLKDDSWKMQIDIVYGVKTFGSDTETITIFLERA